MSSERIGAIRAIPEDLNCCMAGRFQPEAPPSNTLIPA